MFEGDIIVSFNQKKYVSEFNKETYKMFPFRVRKDNTNVIDKLESVPNKNRYITELIENNINPSVLTIKQIKTAIIPVLSKHNIHEVYLFGSYARGEANNKSDVDIYCESGDIKTFIDQGFLEDELVNALGKDVDVIFTDTKLDDFFEKQMKEDLIKLC